MQKRGSRTHIAFPQGLAVCHLTLSLGGSEKQSGDEIRAVDSNSNGGHDGCGQ